MHKSSKDCTRYQQGHCRCPNDVNFRHPDSHFGPEPPVWGDRKKHARIVEAANWTPDQLSPELLMNLEQRKRDNAGYKRSFDEFDSPTEASDGHGYKRPRQDNANFFMDKGLPTSTMANGSAADSAAAISTATVTVAATGERADRSKKQRVTAPSTSRPASTTARQQRSHWAELWRWPGAR
jgi:hypothetical protein